VNRMAVAEEAYRLSAAEALPVIPLYTLAGYLLAEGSSGRGFCGPSRLQPDGCREAWPS